MTVLSFAVIGGALMELLACSALYRAIPKERIDLAIEVASFMIAAGVLSLSAACTVDDCLDACVEVSRVYSALMLLTSAILCAGRSRWPGADLARTEATVSGLRWLLSGPLALPAVYFQAESLKDDAWLRTVHFFCSGLCFLYATLVAPLPLLRHIACLRVPCAPRHSAALDRERPLSALACPEASDTGLWEPATRTCCVCCERPANAMCLPCRHAGTCEVCLLRVLSNPKARCPVCRAPITSYDVTAESSGYAATFVAPPKAAFDSISKVAPGTFCRPIIRGYMRVCCPAMCTTSAPPLAGP
mmetsp:Transcript_106492/g.328972  ORF Transcript_106492/g.328972 Transcript_106492/m.328972 type:complete len:303 (-) Transcript_106492:7-915(-)